jgi:hypothetical protein
MNDLSAMLLLFLVAGCCVWWQRSSLKRQLAANRLDEEWFRALSMAGATISAVLALNGASYLKLKGIEYLMTPMNDIPLADGTIAEPSVTPLLIGQFEVIVATISLVVLVWKTIRSTGASPSVTDGTANLQVLAAVAEKLMVPFWLATIGVGSVFGVSSGFGLKDVVRHAEFLLGPPLIMALELTLFWIVAKVLVRGATE